MKEGFISRRDFLKLSSASLLGFITFRFLPGQAVTVATPEQGRVVCPRLFVRDSPGFYGGIVNTLTRDNILDIREKVFGGVDGDYNRTWYRIGNSSFVYSGWVQPVDSKENPTVREIPEAGVLGEITIPNADSFWGINRNPYPGPRLYYGTTHWITARVEDQRDGSLWYKVYDDLYDSHFYTRPEWVHVFTPEEISPISQNVPGHEKHIEIHLNLQMLVAFEWNVPVHAARVSTGQKNYETPTGWFRTFHKRATYHMTGGADEFSVFDLPGVPWDSYITETGIAIHGTYWHNDFGHTHSHGCINLAPEDAKWIYRWTLPTVAVNERFLLEPGSGTRVLIVQD
jgi:hypothetical protein